VEEIAIGKNNRKIKYEPTEKINTIIVDHFPLLGKLAALRFLEWAQQNEGSTVSLPTGKTPEHFIKWISHLLHSWEDKKTQKLLEENGISPAQKPDMASLSSFLQKLFKPTLHRFPPEFGVLRFCYKMIFIREK
jgi:glucosamine-6-phosphate deaminase